MKFRQVSPSEDVRARGDFSDDQFCTFYPVFMKHDITKPASLHPLLAILVTAPSNISFQNDYHFSKFLNCLKSIF